MKISKDNVKSRIGQLIRAGFVHILGTSVINKIIALITNMIIVRVLTKSEYGFYSYAYNIISIILIFSDIGTRSARLQFCCETNNLDERNAISRFLIKIGTVTNAIFVVLTFLYATFLPLTMPGARFILQLLSIYLLFQFYFDHICYKFRIEKDNKKYALLTNINSIGHFVFCCLGAYYFGSSGLVIGRYISFILPILVGLFIVSRKETFKSENVYIIEKSQKIKIIKYALLIMITNCVSSVLHYFDTFLVGLIITDETILADYKVATIIPNALNFIPLAVITFIYPFFVENKENHIWVKKNTLKVSIGMFIPSIIISGVCIAFAPLVIRIVFGNEYLSAVEVFRVLMLTYVFSASFRMMFGNILVMMHRVKANFWLSLFECVINIISDVVLIKKFGSIGAAYTTLIITLFSSITSGIYLFYVLKKENMVN